MSATLKAITKGRFFRYYKLSGEDFFIRRMSNDDYTDGYKEFINSRTSSPTGNILAAFCPHFDSSDLRHTEHSLGQLQKGYNVFIFVLKHQYSTDNRVTDEEIVALRRFGDVRIFDDKSAEAEDRAKALEDYIAAIFAR
jgi:hypothetical protein